MNGLSLPLLNRPLLNFFRFWFILILISHVQNLQAQGWTFTATLTYSGPCGATTPYIPPITFPAVIPTKADCESLRNTVLSYEASSPVYNSEHQYIGTCRVYYVGTPCSGSDLVTSVEVTIANPGYTSLDGLTMGTAFFSPHESQAIENWINDYIQRLESLGYPIDINAIPNAGDLPLTGNAEFDQFYFNQMADFNASASSAVTSNQPAENANQASNQPANQVSEPDATYGTVMLLTDMDQIKKQQDWMDEHGFDQNTYPGPDNTIDAGGAATAETSYQEAAVLTAVGQAPGLIGVIGDFMINTSNEVFKGIGQVVSDFTSGNENKALEESKNLEGKVVFNALRTTAANYTASKLTDIAGKPVLKLVNGAETVYGFSAVAVDFWKNKTGN